jgi:hypothetical protein
MSNVHEMVTARIIAELEQGTAPWAKPWKGSGVADLPYNALTGHVFFWRLDATLGLLLEAVQVIDPSSELDRVDSALGVATIVFDDLQSARRPEAGHHLGVGVLAAGLCQVDGVPEHVFYVLGHGIQVADG